ncbi:hypothetical protein BKH46_09055 [Helicobacter sp. 12S02634-8]|uniref:restriction endonuclease subunit S n=1 Tax=Helicobacter sp. 12S02634-8 TaxID=1476199 RepID=UPI000BA598BB|nr:restriction endonuclease subunit S [Helicobacter sp. 12S02634-8]PAF46108.1 hypothetical protein BKH46_09055 [Helicobacter sp. 12S02634-8]
MKNKVGLNTEIWGEFLIGKLYRLESAKCSNASLLDDGDEINYVGATINNNGIIKSVKRAEALITSGNCVAFILQGEGSAGYATYQDKDFIGATSLRCGYIDGVLNKNIGIFLATCHCLEKARYSFGRGWGNTLESTIIKLPIKRDFRNNSIIDKTSKYANSKGEIPDFEYMEKFIKMLYKPLNTKVKGDSIPALNVELWGEFFLKEIFEIKKGKRLTAEDQEDGSNNYVGAIDINNGIANKINQAPIHKGNTITLSYNGSVGEAFYQKDDYWATDDVNALYSKYEKFNSKIGMFIATIIKQEKYKFSYGRKWTLENMENTIIKLPIKRDSNDNPTIDKSCQYANALGQIPDFDFMERFINSLPYSDRI